MEQKLEGFPQEHGHQQALLGPGDQARPGVQRSLAPCFQEHPSTICLSQVVVSRYIF